jgi:hypothetical protein
MLELLRREGVEVDDSYIDIATKHGHNEIVRILRQHKEMPRKNSSLPGSGRRHTAPLQSRCNSDC